MSLFTRQESKEQPVRCYTAE